MRIPGRSELHVVGSVADHMEPLQKKRKVEEPALIRSGGAST